MDKKQIYLKFNDFHWGSVPSIKYKPNDDGDATFFNVTRQNLITASNGVDFEVRYFEIGQLGFTTLEKHQHTHIVMIARGKGKVIIGEQILDANEFDYFTIPEWVPHQLMNSSDEPFAFFCSVNAERDKPVLLSKEETEVMKKNKQIRRWIKIPKDYF